MEPVGSLEVAALHTQYRDGGLRPADVIAAVYDRIELRGDDAVWISRVPRERAIAAAEALGEWDATLPLYGIPFAVKDNIDVAGLATTAGCPDFAFDPSADATSVAHLLAAGAIVIGKTNLDQFATGLNGTRSPYGVPSTPFDADYISGGSSSGSAVAVSAGLVSFALGTDTAGSGRVPAGFTNTVGIKPSRGLVSNSGIVPACRSLDCVSVFALTVSDGARVLSTLGGVDAGDAWSRPLPVPSTVPAAMPLAGLRLGVPLADQLGLDSGYEQVWESTLNTLRAAGVQIVEHDFEALFAVGELLYAGPWLAERLSGLEDFVTAHPEALHPVTRQLLEAGRAVSGTEVFRGISVLEEARRRAVRELAPFDAMLTPTTARTFTIAEMLDDPVTRNSALGRFTTFTNLLDLAAIAVPAGFTTSGLPFGVSFFGTAASDSALLSLGMSVEELLDLPLGATEFRKTVTEGVDATTPQRDTVRLAVVGAHLAGMPLNGQLVELGAVLECVTTTSAEYRLYALANTTPPKPGLARVTADGARIEVEVYRLSAAALGTFMTLVSSPLAIGSLSLADGSTVHGFVCEPWGIDGAEDITEYGGWRAYLSRA